MPIFLLPYPVINPILFQWGPLAIRWYALSYIAGLIGGWALIRRVVVDDRYWGGAARPSRDSIDDLLVYCALGVVIGGRLGNVLLYNFDYYFAHPIEIFEVWRGGMAFHGGLIGAAVGIVLFARRYHAPVWSVFDLACLAAPIGLFFGRIANFIKPELWGRPTDVPWAMVFPGSDGVPRHPSQLYEAALEGAALFVIVAIAARLGALQRPALISGLFGVGYGVARTISEVFRDPDPATEALGVWLTKGMLFSAPMIVIGVGLIVWSARGRVLRA